MRKLLLLFTMLLMITACSSKKKDSYLFKYAYKNGDELKYKLTTINEGGETIISDSTATTDVKETANYYMTLNTLEVDKDSIAEFNVSVTAIDLTSRLNGKEVKYDSKNTANQEAKQAFIQYDAILNNPFRIRVNGKGEVLEVTRVDKIVDKLLTLQPPPKPLTVDERNLLAKNLSERAIQPLVQQLFRLLPAKKVKPDSTWDYSYPNVIGQLQINNKVVFTFKEIVEQGGKSLAKVNAELKTSLQGNKNMTEGNITAVFDDPVITGGGYILFDTDKGLLEKSETFTNQKYRVVLTSKDAAKGSKKVDRQQSSKNTLIVELLK